MIKALNRIFKQDKEKLTIPKSVQQVIPVKRIWLDGIWQVGNKYSRCWKFTDINYAIASKDDKTSMFLDYSELLNALDSNATTKITICNKRMNKQEFENSILLPLKGDQYDGYRKEYNNMLQAAHLRQAVLPASAAGAEHHFDKALVCARSRAG